MIFKPATTQFLSTVTTEPCIPIFYLITFHKSQLPQIVPFSAHRKCIPTIWLSKSNEYLCDNFIDESGTKGHHYNSTRRAQCFTYIQKSRVLFTSRHLMYYLHPEISCITYIQTSRGWRIQQTFHLRPVNQKHSDWSFLFDDLSHSDLSMVFLQGLREECYIWSRHQNNVIRINTVQPNLNCW